MGKLNLRDAYRIKGFSGEIERLKGRGFEWAYVPPPVSALLLTDPRRVVSASLTESELTASTVRLAKTSGAGNAISRYPIPIVGSQVSFLITVVTGNWWWRVGNTSLGNQVNIWSSNVPVTDAPVNFTVTADHVSRGGWMGALTNSTVSQCYIRNFFVSSP